MLYPLVKSIVGEKMTDSPNDAVLDSEWDPDPMGPGWYPDPTGSNRSRWWDGNTWTNHYRAVPSPTAPYVLPARPLISPQTPVLNPFIWLMVLIPPVSNLLLFTWNPAVGGGTFDTSQAPLADATTIFSPVYFLLLAASFVITGLSVFFAYLDWQRLRRDGVVRPFHWGWGFLPGVYIIGRTVVVHKVAPGRGLQPIWAFVAVILIFTIIFVFKMSALYSTVASTVPM